MGWMAEGFSSESGGHFMEQQPAFFSIIIPTYNRPQEIGACLESLSRLDYPRDRFEVFVVDDGSTPSLQPVVVCFFDQLDVTLLTQTHTCPAAARNAGAKKARGEFLAFVDDDCMPSPDWLQKLANRFDKNPDHAIGGRTLKSPSEEIYSTTSHIILDVVYAYYNGSNDQAPFFASCNLAMPADQFRSIGGFDPAFIISEDRDLCDRWLSHDFGMTYAPEALVYHNHPLTFYTFWRRYINYGRGAYRYHQARARRGTGRLRPDQNFYIGLIFNPLIPEQVQRGFWVRVLVVMSQIANTIGFFWEGFSQIKRK